MDGIALVEDMRGLEWASGGTYIFSKNISTKNLQY